MKRLNFSHLFVLIAIELSAIAIYSCKRNTPIVITDSSDTISVNTDSTDTVHAIDTVFANHEDSLKAMNYVNADKLASIYDTLVKLNVTAPEIVLAQVITETGYLQSYAYQHKNNLFGFMVNNKTKSYESISDCIDSMVSWQSKYLDITPVTEPDKNYYKFLDTIAIKPDGSIIKYAESESYTNYLKRIKGVVHTILIVYSESYRIKLSIQNSRSSRNL